MLRIGRVLGDLWVGTVKTYTRLLLRDGGLKCGHRGVPGQRLRDHEAHLIERYGQPTSRSAPEIQNKAGARFENEVLQWVGKKVHVLLSRYGDSLAFGTGTIRTKAGVDEDARKRKERTKEGKKDL